MDEALLRAMLASNSGNPYGNMQQGQHQMVGSPVMQPQQGQMMGASAPSGFNFMEDGSLRGVLGGIGREGGGLFGQGFGSMFGNEAGNVDMGGLGTFIPGQGFMENIGSAMPWT